MSLISVLLIIVALGYFIYSVVTFASDLKIRSGMKRVENELYEDGVSPKGSSLSHGMKINTLTGCIHHDEKQSLIWYKRLLTS